MSKYVKEHMTDDLKKRWEGVENALLVDVVGLEANANTALRKRLREKSIHLMVVRNSLARRASEGTSLAAAFEGLEGSTAVVWGGEDIVALAKEVTSIAEGTEFKEVEGRGGVLDGAKLSADDVKAVSKWPTRGEQLSILLGQILSPGASLSSQLLGPGGMLASQVKKKSEAEEGASEA